MRTALVIRAATVAVAAGGWSLPPGRTCSPAPSCPPLSSVLASLGRQLGQHSTWYNAYVSGWAIGYRLLLGVAAGLVFAVLAGLSVRTWAVFEPFLYYLGRCPRSSCCRCCSSTCPSASTSKVGMAAVSAFFPVAITTAHALHGVDDVHLRAARCSAPAARSCWPGVPAARRPARPLGLRLGLAVAVTGVLLAETSVATAGLGYPRSRTTTTPASPTCTRCVFVFIAAVAVNSGLAG